MTDHDKDDFFMESTSAFSMILHGYKLLLTLLLLPVAVQTVIAGTIEKQEIILSNVSRVPGSAALYRQYIAAPFFYAARRSLALVESIQIPQSGTETSYLRISIDTQEIYNFSGTGNETVEFQGVCRDPQDHTAQFIMTEHSPYRGEASNHIFIFYDQQNKVVARYEMDTQVDLHDLLSASPAQIPLCNWRNMEKLHKEADQFLSEMIDNTQQITFSGKTRIERGAYPIEGINLSGGKSTLLESVSKLIKAGDRRYTMELLDGDDDQEIIAISFNEPVCKELSGGSDGVLLRVDQKTGDTRSLTTLAVRPYPYQGVCTPHIWIETSESLHGWLAVDTQPCRYYPVVLDLRKMEYRFLSDNYVYDTYMFRGEDVNQKPENPTSIHLYEND